LSLNKNRKIATSCQKLGIATPDDKARLAMTLEGIAPDDKEALLSYKPDYRMKKPPWKDKTKRANTTRRERPLCCHP